jgi:hypothetical protein
MDACGRRWEQSLFAREAARQNFILDGTGVGEDSITPCAKIWQAGYGVATGGVSTSGGFGLGGRATAGAGRTSIAGGKGGACWLTTGPLAAGLLAGGAFTAPELAAGETAGGRGALTLGLAGSGRGGASADG